MRIQRRAVTLLAASSMLMSVALTAPTALADPPDDGPSIPAVTQTVGPPGPQPPGNEVPSTTSEQPSATVPSTEEQTPSSTPGEGSPTSTPSEAPGTSETPSTSESTQASEPGERPDPAAVAAGCQTYPPTSFQVCGLIKDKYNQMGGPTSFLLFPKSNELTNPGNTGKRTEFLGGNIYWSAATGAHPVAHEFLTEWGNNGYETGFLKYPTTDEIVLANGRRQEFQGGGIFWSPLSGAHTLHGTIRAKWEQLGGETSYLGYPITNEEDTPSWLQDYGQRWQSFQGGAIVWKSSNNTATEGGWTDYIPTSPDDIPAGAPPAGAPLEEADGQMSPMTSSDCPSEIGDYEGDDAIYNCVHRYQDLGGNWNNVRYGAKGRFGQQHYQFDHHVEDHAVELLLQDYLPVNISPNVSRVRYATKFHIGPNDIIGFRVISDWGPSNAAPDSTQFGVVTAYCDLPETPDEKLKYCPDLMPPFNTKTGE